MQAANAQGQSQVAIRRFESGAYANDEAVCGEYIRALALTNQLSRLPVSQLGGGAACGELSSACLPGLLVRPAR